MFREHEVSQSRLCNKKVMLEQDETSRHERLNKETYAYLRRLCILRNWRLGVDMKTRKFDPNDAGTSRAAGGLHQIPMFLCPTSRFVLEPHHRGENAASF